MSEENATENSQKRSRVVVEEEEEESAAALKENGQALPSPSDSSHSLNKSKKLCLEENVTEKTSTENSSQPPPYGSKEYWEQRYIRQFEGINVKKSRSNSTNQDSSQKKANDDDTGNDRNTKDNKKNGNGKTKATLQNGGGVNSSNQATAVEKDEKDDDYETSLAYHSWYFDYNDLRPIMLPLILGGREEAYRIIRENSDNRDDEEEEMEDEIIDDNSEEHQSEKNEIEQKKEISTLEGKTKSDKENIKESKEKKVDKEEDNDDDDDEGEYVEIEIEEDCNSNDDDDEEEEEDIAKQRDGLAKDGPISILEIGCGDVPLGAALALELQQMEKSTGAPASGIVRQILCTDYSPTVVDIMNRQYCGGGGGGGKNNNKKDNNSGNCTNGDDGKSNEEHFLLSNNEENKAHSKCINVAADVPLKFAVADARMLPYENGSFEFILEKGTLDAMLSDKDCGVSNCIQIISECARMLTPKTKTVNKDIVNFENSKSQDTIKNGNAKLSNVGCLLLVSHLNAHTQEGLEWLDEVVIAGLLQGTKEDTHIEWEIEVHGNAEIIDDNPKVAAPPGSPGPAVYVIHKRLKGELSNGESKSNEEKQDKSDARNNKDDSQEKNPIDSKEDKPKLSIPVKFYSY